MPRTCTHQYHTYLLFAHLCGTQGKGDRLEYKKTQYMSKLWYTSICWLLQSKQGRRDVLRLVSLQRARRARQGFSSRLFAGQNTKYKLLLYSKERQPNWPIGHGAERWRCNPRSKFLCQNDQRKHRCCALWRRPHLPVLHRCGHDREQSFKLCCSDRSCNELVMKAMIMKLDNIFKHKSKTAVLNDSYKLLSLYIHTS